jgi:LysM repeat protein
MKHTSVFSHIFLWLLLSSCLLGTACTSTNSLDSKSTHPDLSWNNPNLEDPASDSSPRLASSGRPRLEPQKLESFPSTDGSEETQAVPSPENKEATKEEVYKDSTLASKYTVKKGDSLWIIAKRHGVLLEDLLSYNGLQKDSLLKIGQELLIPTVKSPMPSQNTTLALEERETYIVQRGDTLSEISIAAQSSLAEIKRINYLQSESIYVGQKISLPKGTQERLIKLKASSSKESSKNTPWPDSTYTVKPGDTLSGIAYSQKVSLKELMELNGIKDPQSLRAGQKLKMSRATTQSINETPVKTEPTPLTTRAPAAFESTSLENNSSSLSVMNEADSNSSSSTNNSTSKEEDEGIFDDLTEAPLISVEEEQAIKS